MKNNAIAVLPFVNMSSDNEYEYFSDGITIEIIKALSSLEQLRVISQTSSFYFKGKEIKLKNIANQLNVDFVLEGSVRVAQNIIRITAQLIEVETDYHFWSESWDRKLDNIFEIQDEISILIAEKLREQSGHFEIAEHLVVKQTENLTAYDYWLKGNFNFNKWNPENVIIAISFYEKGIQLDPNHIESYVGLADAYGFMAVTEFMPREETWEKAKSYIDKAYALNPNNSGVHYQLANYSFFYNCSFSKAYNHTLKSIEHNPSHTESLQFMAFLYMLNGDMENANHYLNLALDIDPLNQETIFYKGYYKYRIGNYEDSLKIFNELLKQNDKNIPALIVKLYILLKLGDYESVFSEVEKIPEEIRIPNEILGLSCLANIVKGDKSKVDIYMKDLIIEAENPTSFQAHTYLFLSYVNLGMNNEAFAVLEKSLKMKSSIFLLSYSDPLAESLTKDNRYEEFHSLLYPPLETKEISKSNKSTLLDNKTADELTNKILEYVENETSYLNPALTLRELAERVEIHPNQVSCLLNENVGKNFNGFINKYRVEHFKELVKDPSNSHISLIGLAFESGFNSKTVFNTFFKKEVGMTPSEYVKSNK